jgi:hypothetical protein
VREALRGADEPTRAVEVGAYHGSASREIVTLAPVCGAWMNRPRPTYMPTWPTPSKKTRSPGRSARRETRRPRPNCAYELCGSPIPNRS